MSAQLVLPEDPKKSKREPTAEEKVAEELTGSDGLTKYLTKTVLETALNQELTEH